MSSVFTPDRVCLPISLIGFPWLLFSKLIIIVPENGLMDPARFHCATLLGCVVPNN